MKAAISRRTLAALGCLMTASVSLGEIESNAFGGPKSNVQLIQGSRSPASDSAVPKAIPVLDPHEFPNRIAENRARTQDPEKDCPFASKSSQYTTFREQLRNLSGQIMTADAQNDPRCTSLLSNFKSNSDMYLSLTRAIDADGTTGTTRSVTETEARARTLASDSLANLLSAGCALQNPSKVLESGLMMMDALGGGVMASGVISPPNFVIGAGISAASRLGLALARIFSPEKPEFTKLKTEMRQDSFRDQLCAFRSIYYRLDKLDPDLNTATRRLAEIEADLAKNKAEMAALDSSCAPATDQMVSQAGAWFTGIKAKLDAALAEKESADKCNQLKYLVDEQRAKLEEIAGRLDCASSGGTMRKRDFCAAWKRVGDSMNDPGKLCFAGSPEQMQANAEFQDKARFVLTNAVSALAAQVQQGATSANDSYGQYRKLREATEALQAEAKALTDPNMVLTETDRAMANQMVRELGKLLIRDGFSEYNSYNRKSMKLDFERAQKAVSRWGGDKCSNARQAWDQIRTVRPRMNSIKQICKTLGAEEDPIPPLRDPSRNFNTVTGEESRKTSGLFSRTAYSPLQRNCRMKQEPSDPELDAIENRIIGLWNSSCGPDTPAPR
jgi:hypothetical protein